MRVHLQDGTVIDGDNELVVVELTLADRRNIANMLPDASLYAEFPETYDQGDVEAKLDMIIASRDSK